MINRHLTTIAVIAMFVSSSRADDKAKPVKRTFEITLAGVIDTEDSMKKKDHMTADTRLKYAFEQIGPETVLTLQEIELKTVTNGKPTLDAFMNRSRFHVSQDGKSTDFTADAAPEKLKTMLNDSFGPPLVNFVLDEAGKETKRTQVAGPGAEGVLNKEVIANTRCFHAPFYADKPAWEADVEIGGGSGGNVVSGVFTYTKVPAKKNDRGIVVKVVGNLQPEVRKTVAGQMVSKRTLVGEQIYSPELREWISGEWTIKMTTDIEGGGRKIGSGTGTVIAKMRMIEAP
jgi:hypothetical protein